MKTIKITLLLVLALLVVGAVVVYGGLVDVAADSPHAGLTVRLLTDAREKSIERQAADIVAPSLLADPKVIASGAGEYAEMCTGCHLAPGMENTEMRAGLYPQPPDLTRAGGTRSAAQQFWIIKHGIKATGMPAWGLTHDDERLWSLVAFLRKLPGMNAADYQALVGSGEGGHHHHDEGDHDESGESGGSGEKHSHEHADEAAPTAASASIPKLAGAAGEAAAVVDDFQAKLARGDTAAAAKLLAPSLLVFEGGEAETSRDEYASHHLKADAGFLKTAHVRPLARRGAAAGDLAWVATESEITSHGEKPVNLVSTETMVLEKTPQGWRVAHIHWSNQKKQ